MAELFCLFGCFVAHDRDHLDRLRSGQFVDRQHQALRRALTPYSGHCVGRADWARLRQTGARQLVKFGRPANYIRKIAYMMRSEPHGI